MIAGPVAFVLVVREEVTAHLRFLGRVLAASFRSAIERFGGRLVALIGALPGYSGALEGPVLLRQELLVNVGVVSMGEDQISAGDALALDQVGLDISQYSLNDLEEYAPVDVWRQSRLQII